MIKKIIILSALLALGAPCRSQSVTVFEGHPRLLLRESAWGERSVTVAEVRKRARDRRYAPYLAWMERRGAPNLALKALMLDDREAALKCIKMLENRGDYGNTTDAGLELMWDAMAFDWLYNNGNFSQEAKDKVIANLLRGAGQCIEMYDSQGAHIFHTRMYGFPTGVAAAGLALKGHHPEADRFCEWAYGKYMHDLFPAREVQDGSVHGSLAYGRKYTMWLTGHFIACWYSATGENLWHMIREEQGDWAWREALFLIYAEQPDGKMVRYGDNFFRGTERFSFRVISDRAFAYDEPLGRGYVDYLLKKHAGITNDRQGMEIGSEYQVFLYWDPDRPGLDRNVLPTRTLFSPHGTGMAFWRSGWGPEDTFIFFKCGDYFDNHGHFDAGHVEVFRRAPLLIEAGSYEGGTESQHYIKFFHNSIAHNTIQIVDPADPEDAGSQRFYNNQNMNTIEDYRLDKKREMGNVVFYRDEGDLVCLAADFSAAYPEDRVRSVVRELAWIGERYLVVLDNIVLADSKYQPRILWHYAVKPRLGQRRFTVADGGARAVISVLAPVNAVLDTVKAFTVGTGVYPPEHPRPELGVGRAEVSAPVSADTLFTFVQVIDIADESIQPAEPLCRVTDAGHSVTVSLPTGELRLEGQPGSRSVIDFFKN